MSLAAAIPLIVLACLAGACGVYHAAMWWRISRVNRSLPTLRDAVSLPDPAGPAPSICVIVPAHNEQDVIARIGSSLVSLHSPERPVRVVFVLDRCTDSTERVLRGAVALETGELPAHLEILTLDHCPPDWAGKTHALWRGVRDSKGAAGADLLCFADADTVLDPLCLPAAVRLMHDRRLDLLSLLSTLEVHTWYERLVQPAVGMELIRQFPLDLVNRPDSGRAFANGQFMLFRREAYERLGGHELVKHELLEDLALARKIMWHNKDMRLGVFLADGLLTCRMYRAWPAFRRGWKRIYTEAVRRKAGRLRGFAWRLRAIGGVLPPAALAAMIAGPIAAKLGDRPLGVALVLAGAFGVFTFSGALSRAYQAQGVSVWRIVTYPIGAWFAASILSQAARDLRTGSATTWGGRTYAREIRP